MRILLIEDSENLSRSIKNGLGKLGHAVDGVGDGRRGLSYALLNPYDVIILDLMLPEMDGLEVLAHLRREGKDTPVLILSAKDTVDDRVRGLKEGADDYLLKPFAFDELHARIEALARRHLGRVKKLIEIGELQIDTAARVVRLAGQEIPLQAREYALLLFLSERQGETVSRIELEDHLYGEDNFPMSNVVPATICGLRAKLRAVLDAEFIHTRRGLGYVLSEQL